MNRIDDYENLTRRCWINAVLIRNDGLDCTFQAQSWREFCEGVVSQADGLWGHEKGIARVFGCEEGRGVEEHTLADCRRVVAGVEAQR